MTIDILGDGPEMAELRALAKREALNGGVRFVGWVDHKNVQTRLADADVFAFPSIREFGGAAVLEAMAVGLVPIVVDYGGPDELVRPRKGFLVKLGGRDDIIRGFRSILRTLASDTVRIEEKSAAALRRAREQFTWQAKARQILQVYGWALGRRAEKPWFGMPLPDLC